MDQLYSSCIKRLAPETLRNWIAEERDDIAVIDVRDSDYKYVSINQ